MLATVATVGRMGVKGQIGGSPRLGEARSRKGRGRKDRGSVEKLTTQAVENIFVA